MNNIIRIRTLTENDIPDLLEVLEDLSVVGPVSMADATRAFKNIICNPWHTILVADMNGEIIGTGTVLIQQQFIHHTGRIAHIEDVVIKKKYQGRRLGDRIMRNLIKIAIKEQCHRVILACKVEEIDCKPGNVARFYGKLGFVIAGVEMRLDLPTTPSELSKFAFSLEAKNSL